MTRVLVVDDHDFFRGCLVDLINDSPDLDVIGECVDGSEVAAAVRELQPDVVLLDVQMRQVSGLDAAASLQRHNAPVRVVMLTSDTAESSQAAARAAGASGYLTKGLAAELLLAAIRRVALGGTAWPQDLRATRHLG